MVLGKLPLPGRPASALEEGAGGGCLEIFFSSIFSLLSPSLWVTIRYRLKYFFKGPLNTTNQPNFRNRNAYVVELVECGNTYGTNDSCGIFTYGAAHLFVFFIATR